MVETFLKAIVTPQVRWPEFLQWKITYLEILTNVIGCYWFTGLIHSVCGSRSCAGIWFQTRIAHQNTLRLGTVCLPHTLPQTTQVRCINSDVPSSICVMICVQSFLRLSPCLSHSFFFCPPSFLVCIHSHPPSSPLLSPLHLYLFPHCPTFTIIGSMESLLPLDSIFNV